MTGCRDVGNWSQNWKILIIMIKIQLNFYCAFFVHVIIGKGGGVKNEQVSFYHDPIVVITKIVFVYFTQSSPSQRLS